MDAHQQQRNHHHPHYQQHTTAASSSPSPVNKKFISHSTTIANSPSAEQKRSKFQRSGGSKHTGSWCSLANSRGGGGGGVGEKGVSGGPVSCSSPSLSSASANGGSPSHSARTSAKSSIVSSKSTGSNKSQQSISSILGSCSSLLAQVAEEDVISEDERPILPGVPVRAANLAALVHICVRAFDYKGEIADELENFPRVLFLMHQWFCPSSAELASLFIHHYNESSETLAPCQDSSCHCHGTSSSAAANATSTSNCDTSTITAAATTTTTTTATTTTTTTASSSPSSNSANGNGNNTNNSNLLVTTKDPSFSESTMGAPNCTTSTTSSSSSSTATAAATTSTTYSAATKARIKMMKRSSGSSSNNSSSTSSGSLSHLSQEELQQQNQKHHQHPAHHHHHHPPSPQKQLIPPRCKTARYKASVCQALRYWIKLFPVHFDVDDRLHSIITQFAAQLREEGQSEWVRWLDLSEIPSYDWLRNNSIKDGEGGSGSSSSSRPYRKVSLIFNHLEPDELAHHVTYLEHKIMRRITFQDFKCYAENGTLEDNPVLERSVALFNGLSQWIQSVVLNRATPSQRADVIAKFVHVAKNLRKLQNFNSLMGVVGSLSHSALARLTKTMECVPGEEKKALAELTTLVSSSNNFRQYRKALSQCKGFKIPILGVHLKDLISLHTALPDYVENGLINFRKMTQLYLIFKELQDLQKSMPPAEANVDLLNTLKLSLDFNYSEDEIYELSLAREPRASNSISPTRGPGQQDNANGSYEKQVQAMVDAVFRNYDSNRDGFISRDEFQALSNNFPAIDAFFVLDENRDGMISKLELERYLRNRKNAGASHNFHEQTYFKPTFCIHCSGLLWGLIKQGYKCRNCGVNAHKYCKDYMLHECKMGQLFYFPSPEPQVKRRGFRIRKKSSSQSESGSPPSPKFFNSLEQLSLSTESSEMPVSASSTGILHTYGSNTSIGSGGGSGGSSGLLKSPHSSKDQQQQAQKQPTQQSHTTETHQPHVSPSHHHHHSSQQSQCQPADAISGSSSRGTKGVHSSHLHGTPKGGRRFSILSAASNSARSSSSVPSSPKLGGLSSISIPLLSPCRTFFGHLTTSSSSNNSSSSCQSPTSANQQKNNNAPASPSHAGGKHKEGGKSLASLFSSSSNSSTPTASPSRKAKSPLVSSPKT